MGADLSGKHVFDDRTLFSLIFCEYYLLCEPENCFVAVDGTDVVGYIIGSTTTTEVSSRFARRIIPLVLRRIFAVTIWKYPESFLCLLRFVPFLLSDLVTIETRFPAHFHTNIRAEYQGKGLGRRLIEVYEKHLRDNNISGLYLSTSSKNERALGFYKHLGYKIIHESDQDLWRIAGIKHIIMIKSLTH